MNGGEERKLAAIMFTDMVGYSALFQRNGRLALDLLEEHRRIIRALLPEHQGSEIKTIGDAFLIEFRSALNAALCAVAIQHALHQRNEAETPDRRIDLKIGVHLGDVIHRDGDVYGDGVNIAARLEPLAGVGGICVSMDVERQLRNVSELQFERLAPQDLKNITLPMDLYRIVLPWHPATSQGPTLRTQEGSWQTELLRRWQDGWRLHDARITAVIAISLVLIVGGVQWLDHVRSPRLQTGSESTGEGTAADASPERGKSVAVLPFLNYSEDPANAFFADGIHEDVLTRLALVHDLRVVSRTSVSQYRNTTKSIRQIGQELGVAYVLEGSVRRAGKKVRVTGQLIRAVSDEHVWAKSYDRDLNDIFAIQAELATEIAHSLQVLISPQEKALLDQRPTANLTAYDLYLKSRAVLLGTRTDLTTDQVEDYLNQAVRLDPQFTSAWGMLTLAHVRAIMLDIDRTPKRLTKAKNAIEKMIRLAPEDPETWQRQGDYFYYGYRDYARATERYQKVLTVRPNSAAAYEQLGYLLRRQAQWSAALNHFRQAAALDPRNVSCLNGLVQLLWGLRCYDEALVQARRVAALAEGNPLLETAPFQIQFLAQGHNEGLLRWLEQLPDEKNKDPRIILLRMDAARTSGRWPEVLRLNEQYPYADPFLPHFTQDAQKIYDWVASGDLAEAKKRAARLIPEGITLLEQQPNNSRVWGQLALLQAIKGDNVHALRSARKAVELVPESADAVVGTAHRMTWAKVLAWTGDHAGALKEFARLLQTPYGVNVYQARTDIGWLPLRTQAEWNALLQDPKNNAPLLDLSRANQ